MTASSLKAERDRFDVVYAWGVLHHTGAMWQALGNVADLVADEGLLFVAIYNDQGALSRYWLAVKRLYNRLPRVLRPAFAIALVAPRELRKLLRALVTLNPRRYLDDWRKVRGRRGMSKWHNILDWVGGYPFEVAKPEAIFAFYRDRGFTLVNLRTAKRSGCNEFVFRKV